MDRSEDIEDSGLDRKDGRWTDEQHRKFLQGLKKHGKDWKMIETIVKTRTGSQIRSHAQKYFNKLDRRRQLAWSPVGDQNERHLKGILRHRPNRTKPDQKSDTAFKPLDHLSKQYSDFASSNEALLNAYAFNQSSQPNKSFFCSYVRPLLTNPEIVTNFLKETTDIEPKRDISQSRKSGTARRDSFSLIEGEDIQRHRQFIETVKGKP